MLAVTAVADLGSVSLSGRFTVIYGGTYLVVAIMLLWAWTRILAQAGYSRWWSLLAFVPVVDIAMFFVFALREWPVRSEVALLRRTSLRGKLSYSRPMLDHAAPAHYGPSN
jgi:hypothetical protein